MTAQFRRLPRVEFALQAAVCSLPFSRSLRSSGKAVTQSSHAEERKTWKESEKGRGRKREKKRSSLKWAGFREEKKEGRKGLSPVVKETAMKSQL